MRTDNGLNQRWDSPFQKLLVKSLFAPRPFYNLTFSSYPILCRMRDSELVVSEPRIRFYAGAPLITEEGYALGTLCVIDRTPREFGPDQREALKALSRLALAQLEFRRNLMLLKEALNDRTKEEHERERELRKLQETLLRVLGLHQRA